MQAKESPELSSALTNCFIRPRLLCIGGKVTFIRSTWLWYFFCMFHRISGWPFL